jgi:hypothetical protein
VARRSQARAQQSLVPLFGNDCYVDFDTSRIAALQESNDKKAVWVVLAYKGTLLTKDEARAELGKEPVTDGTGAEYFQAPAPAFGAPASEDGKEDPASEEDPLTKEFKEFGKKQAAIESKLETRVETYLAERAKEIVAHLEA